MRKKDCMQWIAVPSDKRNSEKWSNEDTLLIVMETFSMNQLELAEYCQKKDLSKRISHS